MTTEKQNTGKLGEDIAVEYLIKQGYDILERNYRRPWGEIDIVSRETSKDNELVFVEVKAQDQKFEWRPEENITRHKKRQLSRIIATYLKAKKIPEDQDWRIDGLAIKLNQNTEKAEIEHIKNIILGA